MSTQHTIPAFPVPPNEPIHSGDAGMTLRDYFAAKALVAYFADGAGFALQHEAAEWAYGTADAMMEARK